MKALPHPELQKPWVREMLAQPLLARLATVNPKTLQPHVVPVWFAWDGSCMLVSAFSSTRKVKDVEKNKKIALIVDTAEPTRGILFEGTAELVTDPEAVRLTSAMIYSRYAGAQGMTPEMISWTTDPENRIIKLSPEKVFVWG